jgi:RimJ/RimL family protein N-acetyltransferase
MPNRSEDLRIVSVEDGFEDVFWEHVNRDPFDYFFFILDLKERREQTTVLLAMEGKKIHGLALMFADHIVQFRGNRKAVEKLLEHVNLEKVELQAPLDCEDIIARKYRPNVRHELVLMSLKRGEEKVQISHRPVRLGPEDARRVAAIMRKADPEWWGDVKAKDRRESLEKVYWLGIKEGGKLAAIGSARFVDFGSNIGIIATDKRYRNRGYATSIVSALVREILKTSPVALIHVVSDNGPAVRAYSKVGYKPHRRYLFIRGERITK